MAAREGAWQQESGTQLTIAPASRQLRDPRLSSLQLPAGETPPAPTHLHPTHPGLWKVNHSGLINLI